MNKDISHHYDEACRLAIEEVERLARKILCKHRNLDEFVMAMGLAIFTEKGKDFVRYGGLDLEDRAYFKPLERFLYEWDDYLKLTGAPMRFTADGPVITEW